MSEGAKVPKVKDIGERGDGGKKEERGAEAVQ